MAKTKRAKKRTAGSNAAETLRGAWQQTLKSLGKAEVEVEKQVRAALDRSKKERSKALKNATAQLATLQARVKKERKVAGKMIAEGVQQALAALNIPSRREVADLTKKVEDLSRKIDALKRRK